MRRTRESVSRALALALLARLAACQTSTVDPSEDPLLSMSAYKALAPCAALALSYGVTYVGSTSCEGTDFLTIEPSCVCESTGRLHSAITEDVRWSCGSSDDAYVTSATKVLDVYCDFEDSVDFVTTWAKEADVAPWEIEEIGYLPDCASEVLETMVLSNSLLQERCPSSSGLRRECMCSRTNVVSHIKSEISLFMTHYCNSEDDIPMAENIFDGYCNRVINGSDAEFPTPTGPIGDMTYYIDAMPQYSSLSACAQLGLSSAIFDRTSHYCPTGAQGLASCACLKTAMSATITSTLSELVNEECGDDEERLSEAMDAFGVYCSAVREEETVTVTQSITETFPLLRPSEAVTTGARSTGESCEEGDGQDKCGGGGQGGGPNGNRAGIVAGAVIGGVALIALLIGVGWFIGRRKRRAGTRTGSGTQGQYRDPNSAHKDWEPENYISEHDGRPVSELPTETQPSELYVERSEWGHPLQGQQT